MLHTFKTSTRNIQKGSQRSFHSTKYTQAKLFDKILIANRGEIACRVMRTARKLGIKTVAIFSEADSNALHVQHADEAVCVGPPPTSQSYLNIPAILEAIKKTGAQAVHPGYGFLSENSHFAKILEDNNVVFIGPSSTAIDAMGDKIHSKILAQKAGVHIIPGRLTQIDNLQDVVTVAREIGYPIMIKASAGGGGKGMRIAWNDKEAMENFKLSKDEALSSFGDDRMLIEKYIDNPRHIEIQVMADGQGTTLYLNERECSIQRRNQKVLEEAPSPFIDPATRKAMGRQAVQLAEAVGYRTAGTCEFMVDSQRNFYFLEMNTRLQVEHPITEYTTGLDLVELMIRISAGEKLKIKQEDVPLKGWAMEARVYAEDPMRNFLPSIGYLERYKEPSTADGNVRVDAGVQEGGEISIYYDPLICKLIAYGKNREESITRLKRALDTYVIRGVNHNVPFLRSVLENPRYLKGDITTKFIPQEYPQGFKGHVLNTEQTDELISAASVLHFLRQLRNLTISGKVGDYNIPSSFVVSVNGQDFDVNVTSEDDHFNISFGGKTHKLETDWPVDSLVFESFINSKEVIVQLMNIFPVGYRIQHHGTQYDVMVRSRKQVELSKYIPVKQKMDTTKMISSPMPGKIVSIAKKAGDKVVLGEGLIIMEAMKMRNVLRAERDGVIKKVNVKEGENVPVDAVLIEFE